MKKAVMAILLLAFIWSSGASFSMDVPEGHWAKSHIDSVTQKGIMTRDAFGNFYPNRLTTKIEALLVIYRSVKVGGLIVDEELAAIVSDYEPRFVSTGIPRVHSGYGEDVYPAIAYALDKNIISIEELDTLMINNQPVVLKKIEFAVYQSKALNYYKNENLNKIIILQYKDDALIDPASRKHLMFLIEEGVLSSLGDSSGNFNPDSEVNRMIMATMVHGFLDAIEPYTKGRPVVEQVDIKPIIESEKTISGIIQKVNDNNKTIILQEPTGKLTTLDIKSATITHLGVDVGFDALIQNLHADVTIKNGTVASVELDRVFESVEGEMVSISEVFSEALNFRSMKVKLNNGNYDFKRVYDNTLITINGISAKPSDLKPDYKLKVWFDGYDAKRITTYSEVYDFSAMVEEIVVNSRIRLRMEYGVTFEIDFEEGFQVGDIVKVTMLYGNVSTVENIGKAHMFTGRIFGINIKARPELTVRLYDNVYETHPLARGALILDETGNNTLDIYDLRLDQEVSVSTGIGGIVRIDTGRRIVVVETGNLFTVTQVFESSNILIVTDKEGRTRTLVFALGSGLSILDYNAGDVIYAEGQALTDQIFEATKITFTGK
ncbi:MAG: S-layer homology domain-containing protein [Clostridia bacterium]|nr:S-layer homology domain-containing protein [Clostridia bacterium]